MKNLLKLFYSAFNIQHLTFLKFSIQNSAFIILFSLFTIHCFAQYDFIGRKFNPNQPKPIPFTSIKSLKSIPSLDFTFDSIRPLNELKTGYGEASPWLSPDGNRIYYTADSIIHQHIYMAEKKSGQYKFSNPHPLPMINSNDTSILTYSPWLTNDELNIYFGQFNASTGYFYLCHAKRDSINHDFSIPVNVKLMGTPEKYVISMGGPSLTQDSNHLYLYYWFENNINGICIFNKTAQDEYTYSDTLLSNNYQTGPGTLTSNDLNYFLSLDTYYPEIYVLKRDSVKDKFTNLYYINNSYINDPNFNIKTTPFFSISNNILAFAKADSANTGSKWVIYFAYNFRQINNVKENIRLSNNINIYPNPTENYVELSSNCLQHSFDYYLVDLSGQTIKSGTFINDMKLDLSSFSNGIYILTIIDKNNNQKAYYKIMKL